MRVFLPVYFLVAMVALVGYRAFRVWRLTGINPLAFNRADALDGYLGRILVATEVGVIVSIAAYAVGDGTYALLSPITWLEHDWAQWIGGAVLVLSLILATVAQAQMGTSWRVGVDRENRTELVTHGIFLHTRNPIFFSMRVGLTGLFLCMPNALSLAVVLVANVLIQVQVRLEEKHLESMHGEAYRSYCSKVRRWL